jgi:TonB family protein
MRALIRLFARSLCLVLLIITLFAAVPAQQPGAVARDTARALELYRGGDVNRAIDRLTEITKRRPDDAEAWEALATVLQREGMFGRARPALERLVTLRPNVGDVHARLAYVLILGNERERAVSEGERALELGDQSAEAHYAIAEGQFRSGAFPKALTEAEIALSIKADFLPALITKSLAHSAMQQYSEAAVSLEKFFAIAPKDIDAETWRSQLEELVIRATEAPSSTSTGGLLILTGKEVHQKARVLSKPEPSYTEPARLAGVTGTIVLRAVFAADGEVKRVFVMRALGYGLTTEAVKAARLIKFTPAIKDGQPVSMFIQLEYNFNLY